MVRFFFGGVTLGSQHVCSRQSFAPFTQRIDCVRGSGGCINVHVSILYLVSFVRMNNTNPKINPLFTFTLQLVSKQTSSVVITYRQVQVSCGQKVGVYGFYKKIPVDNFSFTAFSLSMLSY